MAARVRPSRRRASAAPAKPRAVAVGDFVLCGSTRASVPSDWFVGQVLWAGKGDLLIERANQNGSTWREVVLVDAVRAISPIAELSRIQRQAGDAVRALVVEMHDAEVALGAARDAIWRKVGELAEGGLAVIPPDFAAIAAGEAAVRAAVEASEAERPFDEGVFSSHAPTRRVPA